MSNLFVPLMGMCIVAMVVAQGGMPTDDDVQRLMARDAEVAMPPVAFGAKYMSGGAGEGQQLLGPNGHFQYRQNVKTDNALPAYCNPPNPCPYGHSPNEDGCMDVSQFENTAEFSKSYQEAQECICDHEHMRNCGEAGAGQPAVDGPQDEPDLPTPDDDQHGVQGGVQGLGDALDAFLSEQGQAPLRHEVAKKGGSQYVLNGDEEMLVRRKRSAPMTEDDHEELLLNRVKKG